MDSLSVVIPAYNEEANLSTCVEKVHKVLLTLKLDWEIVIVNDGSKDKTGLIAKKLAKKYPNVKVVENKPNRGYGGSLRAGFAASTKEFISWVPADNQFDFSEITRLISKQAENNSDIVSGIRMGGGADPWHRKLNRWGWNTIVYALFGHLASDIDCGFKLIRRDVLNHVTLTAERGAMIDTQLFASARARGFKISETPLTHLPRTAGASTGANLRVIYQSFVDLFNFWWRLRHELLTEQGKAVFRWELFLIILVLLLASFVRLFQIDKYLTFLGDEGRDVRVVRDILTGKNFPFIGPGTSIGNMYLGPFYYYLMAPALKIANFSPVGPAVQVAIIGVFTVALLWWVGRQWFGRGAGIMVALLYALSPTVIIYSRSSWNPNIMPFFALLCMYSLWKVYRFGYWHWIIITGVSWAICLQSHYLGLLLLPSIIIYWFAAIRKNPRPSMVKHTLIGLFAFLAIMSPLLIFDLNPAHKWLNTTAFFKFFTNRQTTVNAKPYKAIPNLIPISSQIVDSLLLANTHSYPKLFTLGLLALAAIYLHLNKGKLQDFLFVCSWLGFALLGLALYKQHIYDHYFGFIFPAVYLFAGFMFSLGSRQLFTKILSTLVFVGLVTMTIIQSPLRDQPNYQLDRTRQIAQLIVNEAHGQPFNLALLSSHNYDESYRYYLEMYQAPYVSVHDRVTSQLFVICEDPACQPIGNPLWEIAAFGWAKIDKLWEFSHGAKIYRLVANPTGKPI
jgi:glycosyltransferase involved in cell wall biosynthesis